MNILEAKIGRLEVVIEKHDHAATPWFRVERPRKGDIIVDCGHLAFVVSALPAGVKNRRTTTIWKCAQVSVITALFLIGASQTVDAAKYLSESWLPNAVDTGGQPQ